MSATKEEVPATSMLSLPVDCLEYIFEYLDIVDHMQLKQTCRAFVDIIKRMWHRKHYNIVIDSRALQYFRDSECNDKLCEFLSWNQDSVKRLKLENIHEDQFHLMKFMRFPNVETLDIDLSVDDYPNDKYTPQMIAMFPSVVKLTLRSCITGANLWNLSTVKELDIDCCEFLDPLYLEPLFRSLNLRYLSILFYGYNTNLGESVKHIQFCTQLEELRIDDHHLLYLIEELNTFPKLCRIVYYTRDYDEYIIKKITDAFGLQMRSVTYNDVFWSKSAHLESLLRMKNLESLIIIEDDIASTYVDALATTLTQLREFRFVASRMSDMEDALLTIVEKCTELEILDISKSKVDIEFLQRLNCAVQKQKKRTIPLQFYCYNTTIGQTYTTEMHLTENLHVFVEEQQYETLGNRFLDCSWVPNRVE